MAKYLDYDGLGKVWAKIKAQFATKSELNNKVSKTGDETITGTKTFSDASSIILQGTNGASGNKLALTSNNTDSSIKHLANDNGTYSAIVFPNNSPDIKFQIYGTDRGILKTSPAVNSTSVDIIRGQDLYNTLEQGGIVRRVGTGTSFTGDNKYWKKIFTLSNPNSKTWTDIDVEFEILGTYGSHMQWQNGLFKAYYSINGEVTSTAIKLNRLSGNFDCNNVVYYKNASNQMEVWVNTVGRYDTVLVKYLTVWHRDLNNKLACTIEAETSTNGYTTSTALPSGTVAATDNGGFVHTSGNESISGVKTFTEKITLEKGEIVHNVSINNSSANTWIRFATIKCIGSYASQNITMDIVSRSGVGRLRFYLTGTNATNGAFTGVVGKWLDYGDEGNIPIWYSFDTSKSEVYLWYKAPRTYEYFSIYNLGWGEYLRDKFVITWERTGTTTTQPTGATQVSIDKISTNIAGTADTANSVAWGNVSGKPSTFTPTIGTTATTAAAGNHTHNYAGSQSAGGPADYVRWSVGSDDASRRVPFAYNDANETTNAKVRLCYDDDFKYNPNTNLLQAGRLVLSPGASTQYTAFRLNRADSGNAVLHLGGAAGTTTGTGDGQWSIYRRGSAAGNGFYGDTGDFSIQNNGVGTNGGITVTKSGTLFATSNIITKGYIGIGRTVNGISSSGGATMQYNSTTQCIEFTFN